MPSGVYPRKKKVDPLATEYLRLYLNEHLSITMIAQSLGVTKYRVFYALREAGVIRTPSERHINAYRYGHGKFLPFSNEKLPMDVISEMYRQGLSCREIAENFNVKQHVIYRRMCGLGIVRNRGQARIIAEQRGIRMPGTSGNLGPLASNWKGGRRKGKDGYILIYNPNHPRAGRGGGRYVFEHVLVWEENHKMPLPKGWIVHHVNGIKDDNRPENLVAYPRLKHQQLIPLLLSKIKTLEMENQSLKERIFVQ